MVVKFVGYWESDEEESRAKWNVVVWLYTEHWG